MKEKEYFIDNQNCLWLPNNNEEITDDFVNKIASINLCKNDSKKKLYLNHSVFMDKFESSDVIVPESVESFFYRVTFRNSIKRIFIPSSVNKIVVSPSSDYFIDEHSIEFIVSKYNENFISVNGSVYTKDFKTLIYCAQKKDEKFLCGCGCGHNVNFRCCHLLWAEHVYFNQPAGLP